MSSNIFYRLALWCLLALVPATALAQQTAPVRTQSAPAVTGNNLQLVIEGKAINVHDGDTITVLDQDNKKFHIRLQGIDAPELKQEAGAISQQNLSRMVLGKQVTIVWTKVDKYRRTVGTIMLDGRDVNIEQVKAGMAWHFKKYEDEQSPEDRRTYAAAEQAARVAQLGLWKVASPTAPGDWRQEVKTKRWGPPPPPGTIVGNSNSKKYHRPDCAGYRDMAERNRVFFKTVAEAEAAGYKRAGNCPAEIQTVRAATAPAPVTPQPIPTNVTPAPPSITLPVAPQIPRPGLSAPTTTEPGLIIGNKNSKVYHLPGCSGYTRVSEKNQVKFNDAAEAEAAGYHLAKNCSPDGATGTATQTPVTKATESAPPAAAATSASTEGKVVGNKNSQIYHLPTCSGYKTVSEKNRVYFDSEEEAAKAGYRKAKNCN
jgi:endonuclease YncB( thermonuclease family)/methylphosphotriester-DNA--protein-cysteine methyltransferase